METMDQLIKLLESSTLLTAFTMGVAQAIKVAAKTEDRWAYLLTLAIGLLFAGVADYAVFQPTSITHWILIFLHGVGVGLLAAGLFKLPGGIAQNIQKNLK